MKSGLIFLLKIVICSFIIVLLKNMYLSGESLKEIVADFIVSFLFWSYDIRKDFYGLIDSIKENKDNED